MAGASMIWIFFKTNLLRAEGGKIWRGPAFNFSRLFTSNFEVHAVDRSVFYHLSPGPAFPAPNPYHIISTVTALQAATQLEVACLLFCVLCNEHLAIHRPVCPRRHASCWHRLLFVPLLHLYQPHYNLTSTGWRRWRAQSPSALASGRPPRAPSPPSPTSSPSFSVRLIDYLCLSSEASF